jgi:hypothetical protein
MDLQQTVLCYLTEKGPTNLATLSRHFDQEGRGEVGSALGHLAACKYIALESSITKITALGTERLKFFPSLHTTNSGTEPGGFNPI